MPKYSVERSLPYTPEQLFAVAGDVENYPAFLPWVTSMRVWNRTEEPGGGDRFDAEAQVGFSFLRERFATRVRRDPSTATIRADLLSGPFRKLETVWGFTPEAAGSRVRFTIDFDFRTRLLNAVLHANMDRAVARLIAAFEARARALYG